MNVQDMGVAFCWWCAYWIPGNLCSSSLLRSIGHRLQAQPSNASNDSEAEDPLDDLRPAYKHLTYRVGSAASAGSVAAMATHVPSSKRRRLNGKTPSDV